MWNIRLASLVSVIRNSRLARCHRSIINQLQKVLSVSGDNGKLLAVLTEGIELVGEGSLELLAGDVGQLSLSNQRFGLGTDKLLLENNDARAVGFLVLELGDLVGDLLLAWN